MPCPVPMLAAGAHPVVPVAGVPAIAELAITWTPNTTADVSAPAGDNRILIVSIGFAGTDGETEFGPGVTYGGVSLSGIQGGRAGSGTFVRNSLLWLDEAGIASRSGDTMNVTNVTSGAGVIWSAFYANVDQGWVFSDRVTTDSSTPNPLTDTMTVVEGSLVFASSSVKSTVTPSATWQGSVPLTKRDEVGGTGSRSSIAHRVFSAAATANVECLWSQQDAAVMTLVRFDRAAAA